MSLKSELLKKATARKLAHFYIVEATGPQDRAMASLVDFVQTFVKDYYQKVEIQKTQASSLLDHPDVLVLGNLQTEEDEKEPKAFTVLEAEQFARFFEFRPVQSTRKFAIITEAHRINPIVANKWLKLLEEPTGETTIFLLNPRRLKLLDTIHSRAIHLRLTGTQEDLDFSEWNEFLEDVKSKTLSEFLETHSRGDRDLSHWVNQLILWESEQTDHPTPKCALMDWIKNFQMMEVFHQPTATKWTLFYSFVKEHVIPRQNR